MIKFLRRNPCLILSQPLYQVCSLFSQEKNKSHKHFSSPSLGIPSSDSKPLSARLSDFKHE